MAMQTNLHASVHLQVAQVGCQRCFFLLHEQSVTFLLVNKTRSGGSDSHMCNVDSLEGMTLPRANP